MERLFSHPDIGTNVAETPSYEKELDRDPRWALSEGSRHFEEKKPRSLMPCTRSQAASTI